MKLLFASNNAGKIREIREIFGSDFDIITLREAGIVSDPEETGKTFAENAYIKAESGMRLSGLPCMADDSGLCVEALNGAPGVYSARFAGEPCDNAKNNALLLEKLKGKENRRGKYVCSICLVFPDGKTVTSSGECEGEILDGYRGTNGFGYDPLFYVPELKKTFAEASPEEKNGVSHRARALKQLREMLQ